MKVSTQKPLHTFGRRFKCFGFCLHFAITNQENENGFELSNVYIIYIANSDRNRN